MEHVLMIRVKSCVVDETAMIGFYDAGGTKSPLTTVSEYPSDKCF